MAEKEQVIKEKVENAGIFDFSKFYSYAHYWFKDEGFGVDEEKYSEKVSGNKRDIDIEWTATKLLSDYFKIEYKLKFEIRDLIEVEAEIEGKKKKLNQGKVSVEIKGNIIMDHQSKWDTSSFSRFARDVYNKYIIPTRVHDMKEMVSGKCKDFKEQLKAYLELSGRRK